MPHTALEIALGSIGLLGLYY